VNWPEGTVDICRRYQDAARAMSSVVWETETVMNGKPGAFAGVAMLLQPGILNELKLSWRLLRDERSRR
jgi:hypothetical protein